VYVCVYVSVWLIGWLADWFHTQDDDDDDDGDEDEERFDSYARGSGINGGGGLASRTQQQQQLQQQQQQQQQPPPPLLSLPQQYRQSQAAVAVVGGGGDATGIFPIRPQASTVATAAAPGGRFSSGSGDEADRIIASLRQLVSARFYGSTGVSIESGQQSQQQQHSLREIFYHFDRRNVQYFNAEDLVAAAADLRLPIGSAVAPAVIRALALDGGDKVSFGEFLVFACDPDHITLQVCCFIHRTSFC
jgi:hypothetical protein